MNPFSMGNAWSLGFGFFSRSALNHAIILIGVGIVAPFILQYVIAGGPTGMMNPAMMGESGLGMLATAGGAFLLVMVVSYVLQTGSYFGSWRLGFGADETLGGAIVYGLVAGLLAVVALAVLFIVLGLVVSQSGSAGGAILVALLFLIPLMLVFAILYTVLVAVAAVAMFLALLLALAFGASMGELSPALDMTGGGGLVVLVALAIIMLLFWATVRFSCVTSAMAHRKTFNPIVGLSESWRLTAANQWRIMGYLALIGVVLLVVIFVATMIVGASMLGSMQGGGVPDVGLGTAIISLLIGIPIAYLVVLVPAGIYRELGAATDAAEVFA